MKKLVQFIRESIAELQKVSWPERDVVIGSTWVVLIMVFFMSALLWGMDLGISEALKALLQNVIWKGM